MADARAKADARKKKILERGSDRMAIATGQKVILMPLDTDAPCWHLSVHSYISHLNRYVH